MKVKYVSDLHLEFSRFPVVNVEKELGPNKDQVLLVAGDTVLSTLLKEKRTDGPAKTMKWRFDEFLDAAQGFKQVYMVAGNHEAYQHGDVSTNQELVNEYISSKNISNIRMLENERVPLTDKVDLLACTLWTSMSNHNPVIMLEVGRRMNDFYVSNYKGEPFLPNDAADIHDESRRWMTTELLDTSKDYVVMTHHLPSFQGIDPHFKGDVMNHGYATSMEDFIYLNPHIKFWIHGHTHYNVDYVIEQTRILGNMRGYPPGTYSDERGYWSNFKADKWIEV